MKNTTFNRSIQSLLIAAALGFTVAHAQTDASPALTSASAVAAGTAPVNVAPAPVVALKGVHIKDLKIGMVIEGPITLPGLTAVPLPTPPGKWEVLQRMDEMKAFGFRKIPFVNLIMGNTDPTAQQKAFTVSFNVETAAIDPIYLKCDKTAAIEGKGVLVRSNFDTTTSTLNHRCVIAKRFATLNEYNVWSMVNNSFGHYIVQPQYFPKQLPIVFKGEGSLLGSRIARWAFYFEEASYGEAYSDTDPRFVAMQKQVEIYGEQMRKFANNERGAEFPAEYFPTK